MPPIATPRRSLNPYIGNLKMNDPNRQVDPSGHYPTQQTIGGSGKATAAGVTQAGATTDVDGGFHQAPTASFGFGGGRGGYGGGNGPQARIGNRGGVMAPPSPNALEANGRSEGGSLDNFYASRAPDPFTGLAVNPMANDVMQQRARLQGAFGGFNGRGPDLEGLSAVDAYNHGQQSKDPYLSGAAANAIEGIRWDRGYNKGMNSKSKSTKGTIDWTKVPMDTEGPFSVAGRADGGSVNDYNPYLVAEEGPELFVSKNGDAEILGEAGPEIRTFGEKGTIIPNHKIKPMAEGGPVNSSPGFFGGIANNFKRNFGQSKLGREFGLENWATPEVNGPLPTTQSVNPLAEQEQPSDSTYGMGLNFGNLFRGIGGYMNPLSRMNRQPQAPQPPSLPNFHFHGANPLAQSYLPTPPQQAEVPEVDAETGNSESFDNPSPISVFQSNPLYNPSMANTSLVNSAARKSMTFIPNVRTISPSQSTEQSFLTPYGTAGVSFGQPKKEAMFYDEHLKQMIPASDWFAKAANRQGDNKYAKAEKGSEGSKEMQDKRKEGMRKLERKA